MKVIKNYLNFFLKLDPFSKVILITIITIVVALTIESITKSKPKTSNLRQFSKTFKLELNDYYFNSGFKSRLVMDNILILKLRDSLSREDYNKLSFEISPQDQIKPEYADEKTIKIYFEKKMPENENKNTLLIIRDNEVIQSVTYQNTNYGKEYYEGLNELRVSPD